MAPKPKPKLPIARFVATVGMVLATLTILAVMTWAAELVTDLPPSTFAFVLRRSNSFLPPTLDARRRAGRGCRRRLCLPTHLAAALLRPAFAVPSPVLDFPA